MTDEEREQLVRERDEALALYDAEAKHANRWCKQAAEAEREAADARADAALAREALRGLKQRQLPDGPCWCFLWSDEEANAESVLSAEGHCDECTLARKAVKGGG